MVRIFAIAVLVVVGPQTSVAAEAEPHTPKRTLDRWAKAWQSGQVEEMLTFYVDTKDLIAVASSGHSYRGLDGVRKMYQAAFREATWEKVALEELEIHDDGNTAWGVCRFRADFSPVADKDVELTFTSQGSFVLRKDEGGWRIVLEHFSPIADVPRVQPRGD